MIKDRFDRDVEVIELENGFKLIVDGVEVISSSIESALNTINSMAPEGWVEPEL